MRSMRRQDRQTSQEQALEILDKCIYGVMSTADADNQPYGVPLSYALGSDRKCIYFHCAKTGHKLDNIANNSKACFTVIGETKVLPEKFSTDYESTVVFGLAKLVEGEEKIDALNALVEKYSPEFKNEGTAYIERAAEGTTVFKLEIEGISGKCRK